MKRLLLLGLTFLVMAASLFVLQLPQTAAALQAKNDVCAGVGSTIEEKTCKSPGPSLDKIFDIVINIFSSIVGIIAVIMIILAGFRYVTSGGDSGNISSAKNTLIYAIVGLAIAAFAQFIAKFVLNKLF